MPGFQALRFHGVLLPGNGRYGLPTTDYGLRAQGRCTTDRIGSSAFLERSYEQTTKDQLGLRSSWRYDEHGRRTGSEKQLSITSLL
jgi:hypothetical protein